MKELIAMSDCPEIQNGWQPKMGDAYIDRRDMNKWFYWGTPLPTEQNTDKIYIPSIEDMLEKLGDMLRGLNKQGHAWEVVFYVDKGSSHNLWADTPLKALIKAYMHVNGKTWNGRWSK